jgi:hypothetical protein
MSETSATLPESTTKGMSLLARFIGILTAPRETFADVVARPRWFSMMALVLVFSAVFTGAFFSTPVGQAAWLDQVDTKARQSGTPMPEAQYAQMQKIATYMAPISVVSALVFAPLMWLVMSGILFAVFNAALGGDSTFKQVFTVMVHSGAVGVVQQLFVTPLNYFRETLTSATNLSVFLPMLEEGSFAAKFLGTIDLFLIWWVVVLAIGLSVLYRRKVGPILAGLFTVYGIVAVAIAWFSRGGA